MRTALALMMVAMVAIAGDTPVLPSPWTAPDGTELINPKITSWDSVTMSIRHDDGMAKYELSKLSPDLKAALGYDPATAAKVASQVASAQEGIANQRAKAAALERRFAVWTQELARKKALVLSAPGEMLRSGAGIEKTADFRKDAAAVVSQFEDRLKRLRELVARLDANDVNPAVIENLINNVYAEKVSVGMPREAVILAWGKPTDINGSMSSGGSSEQLIYRHSSRDTSYVYIGESGLVTAIQN